MVHYVLYIIIATYWVHYLEIVILLLNTQRAKYTLLLNIVIVNSAIERENLWWIVIHCLVEVIASCTQSHARFEGQSHARFEGIRLPGPQGWERASRKPLVVYMTHVLCMLNFIIYQQMVLPINSQCRIFHMYWRQCLYY